MRIIKSIGLTALAAVTLASCSSLKNMTVPTMETAVSMATKKGSVSDEQSKHWAHADLETDTIPGMSLDKAYKFLEGKTGETVIVAVIDSGIDIEHEDLKNVVWTNTKEIAGNGIDDDNNGYVDDIHGWNYLGGDGVDAPEQLEITRIIASYDRFEGKTINDIAEEEKPAFKEYEKYLKAYKASSKRHFEALNTYSQNLMVIDGLKKHFGMDTVSLESVNKLTSDNADIMDAVGWLKGILNNGFDYDKYKGRFEDLKKNKNYDLDFDGRAIVGDNPIDINDTTYGNPNVIGSVDIEIHGTHVAGIILAERNNGVGMNGVAHNAKLMSLRAVPDGDERDKDVAAAIRYAADNGAKVVNMSFGKSFSPHRHWVFDAIKYAEEKDVLLVHAAGNDAKNIDRSDNWPTDSKDKISEFADNVLTIGAMSVNYNEGLPASFTNYGKLNVDVFAPGVRIYSTFPKNAYQKISGTSMASPEVAGVATLIRSYYPQLSASQVKHIIMNSGSKLDMEVNYPGKKGEKINFSELSISGSVANAYNALVLADKMVNGE